MNYFSINFGTFLITCLLNNNYCLSAAAFYNQIDDIAITSDGKTIWCDRIKCPVSTVRCIVTKKTYHMDRTKTERINMCINQDNHMIEQESIIENYSGPIYPLDIYLENGNNGLVSRINGMDIKQIKNNIFNTFEKYLPEFIRRTNQKVTTMATTQLRPVNS